MEYLLPFCRNARDASAFKDCCSKIVRIGFTKEDTYKFLKDYELDDFAQKVKDNYDGYKL